MSTVVTQYQFQSQLALLQSSIHQLSLAQHSLSFYSIINSMIHLLQNLSLVVRSKENKYGSHLPQTILIHIFGFLSKKGAGHCQWVCKRWCLGLRSSVAKKIIPWMRSLPAFCKIITLEPGIDSPLLIDNHFVFYSEKKQGIAVYNTTGQFMHMLMKQKNAHLAWDSERHLAWDSESRLLCVQTNQGCLLVGLDGVLVRKLDLPGSPLTISDGLLYTHLWNEIFVYSMAGVNICSWRVEHDITTLTTTKNEVYISSKGVVVYSKEGRLLREWEVQDPFGITVHKQLVYVCSRSNARIEVYDLVGELLGHFRHPDLQNPADVIIDNEMLYVTDLGSSSVYVFDLY